LKVFFFLFSFFFFLFSFFFLVRSFVVGDQIHSQVIHDDHCLPGMDTSNNGMDTVVFHKDSLGGDADGEVDAGGFGFGFGSDGSSESLLEHPVGSSAGGSLDLSGSASPGFQTVLREKFAQGKESPGHSSSSDAPNAMMGSKSPGFDTLLREKFSGGSKKLNNNGGNNNNNNNNKESDPIGIPTGSISPFLPPPTITLGSPPPPIAPELVVTREDLLELEERMKAYYEKRLEEELRKFKTDVLRVVSHLVPTQPEIDLRAREEDSKDKKGKKGKRSKQKKGGE